MIVSVQALLHHPPQHLAVLQQHHQPVQGRARMIVVLQNNPLANLLTAQIVQTNFLMYIKVCSVLGNKKKCEN